MEFSDSAAKMSSFSPVKTNLVDARGLSKQGMPTYSAASGEALRGSQGARAAYASVAPPAGGVDELAPFMLLQSRGTRRCSSFWSVLVPL